VSRAKDEAEIRDMIERWAKAVRSGKLEEIVANHSGDILMFDLPEPPQSKGIDAYKKSWDQFFHWFKDSGVFDLSDLKVTAGDEVAFATSMIPCRGTEDDGSDVELGVRLTVGLQKLNGRWIITHEHHSEPSRAG
jgi:ketosteroid isomerase-like protein